MKCENLATILILFLFSDLSHGFQLARPHYSGVRRHTLTCVAAKGETKKGDNKAMAFLRKRGKVGGSANQFTNSMGVDEGPVGKTSGSAGGIKVRLGESGVKVW